MGRKKAIRYQAIKQQKNVLTLDYNLQNSQKLSEFLRKWLGVEKKNLIIEIGCGKGEHILELAKKYPENLCAGVDLKADRIFVGAENSLQNDLKNCVFVRARVEDFLQNLQKCLPDLKIKIQQIWITFPDPQAKNEEKSLVSATFKEKILPILSAGSKIVLKTDSDLVVENFLKNYKNENFEMVENEILPVRSAFEVKFNNLGINTKQISFIKK